MLLHKDWKIWFTAENEATKAAQPAMTSLDKLVTRLADEGIGAERRKTGFIDLRNDNGQGTPYIETNVRGFNGDQKLLVAAGSKPDTYSLGYDKDSGKVASFAPYGDKRQNLSLDIAVNAIIAQHRSINAKQQRNRQPLPQAMA